jgi:GH35 family endo-1,4-beta-xylanase
VTQSGELPKVSTQNANIASAALAVARNETSTLPDLKAGDVAHPHVRPIVAEVANLHPKLVLMGGNPDEAMAKFNPVSVEGRADFALVDVEGMPFKKAWRIDTERKPQEWQTFLQSLTKERIRSGDILYLTAWTRLIRRTDGQAFGAGRLYATQHREGNDKDASPLGQQDFSIPQEWTRIHIPLESTKDLGAQNIMKLMFTFGFAGQTVEFGGLTVINMGPGVSKESLPHPKLNLDYKGRDPKAAWRKAAAARIEKHRKGDLRVLVVDASGKPLPNATVKVDMTRHAFHFGSSFPGSMLPKEYQDIKPWNADFQRTAGASPEDKKKMQETFLRLFNATTAAPTWSTWGGADARISQSDVMGIMRWFAEHDIPNFNLQAVYPSPEFTAPAANKEFFETKKKAEFAQALKEYVTLAATKFPGIKSIQIANEIEGRPQYTDLLGRESVPQWFKWVKEVNPQMATEINGPYSLDGRPLQTQNRSVQWPGKDTEGLQYYYDLISWLLKQGAPIDYIGFQNHSGIGAAGPEAVLKSLNDFSSFGKPLEITEFEVTIQNPNDAEQRQYQADYLRDYFTVVFSHPQVHMIMLQDFWQPAAWQYEAASAMFNKDWSINPHSKAYEDLVLNQWWTRANGKANLKGEYSTRAFKGDYQISVTANGKTITVPAKVGDKASVVTVKVG